MKKKPSTDYERGYHAGYGAAMRRRLVRGKPRGKPQQQEPRYQCAKCGAISFASAGEVCPKCGSAEISGQVEALPASLDEPQQQEPTHLCGGCNQPIVPILREQGVLGEMQPTCPLCGATRLILMREWIKPAASPRPGTPAQQEQK